MAQWFKIRKEDEKDPSAFFTLGMLADKTMAIAKLNGLFAKEDPSVKSITSKESLFLVEGPFVENNKKEDPLVIIGDGQNRIAKIGS